MPQTAIDNDVADFLDEVQWTRPVIANATSKLNAWTRWLTAHTPPARCSTPTPGISRTTSANAPRPSPHRHAVRTG